MSLRGRVAVLVGGICAIAIATMALVAAAIASRVMHDSVDDLLDRRARVALTLPDLAAADIADSELARTARLAQPLVQAIASDGTVVFDGGLPVDDETRLIAGEGLRGPAWDTAAQGGRTYRILTTALPGGGAVQFAEDITELESGLRRLRFLLVPAGLLTGAAAGLLAWARAGRLVRPIVEVAEQSEAIAHRRTEPRSEISSPGGVEIDRLVRSFNAMTRALRAAEDEQQRLVGDVGHELRTPLTGLRTRAELLAQAVDLDNPTRTRLVDGIVADVTALDELISELLDLAAGEHDEGVEDFDVDDVVQVEAAALRRGRGRSVEVLGTPHRIVGHKLLVGRAVGNLLRNADRYDSSTLAVHLWHTVEEGESRIVVVDHGPGITPDERSLVFQRFRRGSNARGDGNGMGLAIVDRVARLHHGTTWIDDAPDGGAIVGFSIRSLDASAATSRRPHAPDAGRGG